MKQTFGTFREWCTTVLHEQLTKIIESKQSWPKPYYIHVIIKNGYFGPPPFGNANNLISNAPAPVNTTKDMNFFGKHVISTRFILMDNPPIVPMIGTGLWSVNNQTGEIKCIYILPPDTPTLALGDEKNESELVGESAKKGMAPLFYSN